MNDLERAIIMLACGMIISKGTCELVYMVILEWRKWQRRRLWP